MSSDMPVEAVGAGVEQPEAASPGNAGSGGCGLHYCVELSQHQSKSCSVAPCSHRLISRQMSQLSGSFSGPPFQTRASGARKATIYDA